MEAITEVAQYHLCVTHSPLVTRVFEAAMQQKGISADAVRSIAKRGVSFPGTGRCLDDVARAMEACFKQCSRRGYREAWKRLDDALVELTGGKPFEAYVPHANNFLFQEIISHPQCVGYSFLEEGFTSMLWDTWRKVRSKSKTAFRNGLRTWWVRPNVRLDREMFDHSAPTYRAAYAISKHAFHDMPGRTDVSSHVPPLPSGKPPGNTYLILDACYLHDGIRWADYEDALVEAVLKHALPAGEVRVKFHFVDAKAAQRFDSLRRRLEDAGAGSPRLLSGEFSLEDNLTGEDLVLFAATSLGYYNALAGGRVHCFAGEVKGITLDSWIAAGRLPADFRQVVGLVES